MRSSDQAHSDIAGAAGLNYVDGDSPGFRRVRRGEGFSYLTPSGDVAGSEARERIESLVVPPAWDDVWVSLDEDAHLQATGYDEAGRKQYVYHPRWEEERDRVKFERLAAFAQGLVGFRKRVDRDLRREGLDRRKVVALAVAVLDRTLIRVGNQRYAAENDTYGLTTLTNGHVDIEGDTIVLEFEAKAGTPRQPAFEDARLARLISQCRDISGERLFSYRTADGVGSVDSTNVNDYLADAMGEGVTSKDFRVWGATTTLTRRLGSISEPGEQEAERDFLVDAIDVAAERIGNSRSVCRESYVHPTVIEAYEEGDLLPAWKRSRTGRWVDRAESTVRYLLTG